ncbi:hypothetical protein BB560_002780 [Smittium megazygosporum]|uniref:C2 domain-containing protein n=1 Tax=Smittium megazygosporum TaxID=133381 RepID=A0A2T9ZDU2_9FUNG|nr:hypothetical protein BB560_002780 [Smittium megazygosporum]
MSSPFESRKFDPLPNIPGDDSNLYSSQNMPNKPNMPNEPNMPNGPTSLGSAAGSTPIPLNSPNSPQTEVFVTPEPVIKPPTPILFSAQPNPLPPPSPFKLETSSETGFIVVRKPRKLPAKPSDTSGFTRVSTISDAKTTGADSIQSPSLLKALGKKLKPEEKSLVGWEEVGEYEATGPKRIPSTPGELVQYLDNTGMWRNCAGLFSLLFFVFLLTKLGFGLFGFVIVSAFGGQWYYNSVTRFRRAARDDIKRSMELDKLVENGESAGWMNEFLSRFWLSYEPVLSATVVQIAEGILDQQTPAFLDSLKLTTFTLGSKAPRIESIQTYSDVESRDLIVMDWETSFTPNDILDMPRALLKDRVNPKVELSVRVGKGIVGAALPILVENMVFRGKLQVRLYLTKQFPHVKTAEVSFVQKPLIDFVLKPVGGNTFGFDIAHIPGLRDFIMTIVHSSLGPMLYAPNYFTLDIDSLLNGTVPKIDGACGIAIINLLSAKNLPKADTFGKSDPYVLFSVPGKPDHVLKSTRKEGTLNPVWNETLILFIFSEEDDINFDIYDWNQVGKDDFLGSAKMSMKELLDNEGQVESTLPLKNKAKNAGDLSVKVSYYPVAKSARDLASNASAGKKMNVSAEAYLDQTKLISCPEFKKSDSPVWELGKEVFVVNQATSMLNIVIKNNGRQIGTVKLSVLELVQRRAEVDPQNTSQGTDWLQIPGLSKGQVRVEAIWKPILIEPDVLSALGSNKLPLAPPVGMAKFTIMSAKGLRLDSGQSQSLNTFVNVQTLQKVIGQTYVAENTSEPIWNHVICVPVIRAKQSFTLECASFNKSGATKVIGDVVVPLGRFIGDKISENKLTVTYSILEPIELKSHIRGHGKKGDGRLIYKAEFIPLVNLCPKALQKSAAKKSSTPEVSKENSPVVDEDKSKTESVDQSLLNSKQDDLPEDTFEISNEIPGMDEPKDFEKFPRLPNIDYSQFTSGIVSVAILAVRNLPKAYSGVSILTVLDKNLDLPIHKTSYSRRNGQSHEWENETFMFVASEIDLNRIRFQVSSLIPGSSESLNLGKIDESIKNLILRNCFNQPDPVWIPLDEQTGEVLLTLRFDPTEDPKLTAEESIANNGVLNLDIISGHNLPAADSSGTSDPYVNLSVNGAKVWKTDTVKKTLNPVWNARTNISIMNRKWVTLGFDVFDWNQIQSHDLLGSATLQLEDLALNKTVEKDLYFTGQTPGANSSYLKVRLMFTPCHVNRPKEGDSSIIAAVSSVAGAPITIIKSGSKLAGNLVAGGATKVAGGGIRAVTGSAKFVGSGAKAVGGGAMSAGASAFKAVGGVFGRKSKKDPERENTSEVNSIISRKSKVLISEAPSMKGGRGDSQSRQSAVATERKTPNIPASPNVPTIPSIPASPNVPTSPSIPTGSNVTTGSKNDSSPKSRKSISPGGENSSFPHPGILNVKIVDAEILDGKDRALYAKASINMRSLFKSKTEKKSAHSVWNESFSVPVLAGSDPLLQISIKENVRFGENKVLLDHLVDPFKELESSLASSDFSSSDVKEITLKSPVLRCTINLDYKQNRDPSFEHSHSNNVSEGSVKSKRKSVGSIASSIRRLGR